MRSRASRAQDRLLSLGESAYERLAGSAILRRITYANRNRRTFSDLYQHDSMLADRVRVDTYAAALAKHVRPGDAVVDLGTGTGILSFLAVRADPGSVYAIDHSSLIDAARAVAAANGIHGIEFQRVHSRQFSPPRPVDVIVHEQMGEALFDERMVENVVELRDRVLRPGGRILPARFELYLEPVQLHDPDRVPFAWEHQVHGIDFSPLRERVQGHSRRYRMRSLQACQISRLLTERSPILTVDLERIGEPALPRSLHAVLPAVRDGRLDGLCVSFAARFDDELWFDSSPFAPPERRPSSWEHPFLRHEAIGVGVGDQIRLDLQAGDLADTRTWRWSVTTSPARVPAVPDHPRGA